MEYTNKNVEIKKIDIGKGYIRDGHNWISTDKYIGEIGLKPVKFVISGDALIVNYYGFVLSLESENTINKFSKILGFPDKQYILFNDYGLEFIYINEKKESD